MSIETALARRSFFSAALTFVVLVLCLWGRFGTATGLQNVSDSRPELVLQTGHALGVNSIAFSPDGNWLASAAADNTIIIWQTSSGRQLRALKGHTGYVRTIAISPDGHLLASGSSDRTIKIWDVESGREVRSFQKHTGPVLALAFSPDGRWLASGSADNTIKIWNLTSDSEPKTLAKHTAPVTALSFNTTGTFLISAANTELVVWDVNSWQAKQTFQRHTAPLTAVTFADQNTVASGARDGSLLIWRVGSDRERLALKHNPSSVLAVKFVNDSLLAIHADGGIDTWDAERGTVKRSVAGDKNAEQLAFVACSNDGSLFASTTGSRTLATHNRETGEVIRRFETRATGINSIATSANGRWFALAANDSSVRLWQVATGRELPRLMGHSGYVTTVAFSPNSSLLASGSRSGQVNIWNVDSAQLAYSLPSHTNGVNSIAFSSDGKFLAVVGMDPKVELWDLEKKQGRTFAGHAAEITSVAFAGDMLISAGRDKTIRIWNVNTGATVNSWETPAEINGISVNPQGDLLATADLDTTVRIWDIKAGALKTTLTGHTAEVWSVAFSPDGNSLASGSADHTTIVWDLKSPGQFQQLKRATDKVNTVAYSVDGKWLFTGSDDGTIVLWEAATHESVVTLVSLPGSDDWLVATPDGLFDGSPNSWEAMLWRFEAGTFKVVPVEAYFNEFYYPSVLAEILMGQKPRAIEDIARKDRRQPSVNLKLAGDSASRSLNLEITLSAAAPDKDHRAYGGAKDVRLFRNGLLVKAWTGDVIKNGTSTTIQATVPIVAGENKFTAYAFNGDNVKSSDANLVVTGPDNLKRKGTAYLLMIGVEVYDNPEYNLRYSAADVAEMAAQLKAQQERLGQYDPIVPIALINAEATKANILLALNRLAGNNTGPLPANAPIALTKIKPAQPEDAVVVYFSGHGVAAHNHFYLIPHDMGYKGARKALDQNALEKLLVHGVSDDELETALQPLDANQLLLVIDACYSGQAIESTEKRHGPMNTKGLAQLAYEKGIYVLTASQNMEVAFEAEAFKHSYLAHALIQEGLEAGLADENGDGSIFLEEWFNYASSRVPQLRKQILKSKELVEEEADEQKVQTPRVFYTRDEGAKTFLVGRRLAAN